MSIATVPAPSFAALAERMRGRLVTASDPDWDAIRSGFNLATDLHPAAVALPLDAADVVAAIEFAREAGLRVAPQGGAQDPAALGDLDETLRQRSRKPGGAPRRLGRGRSPTPWCGRGPPEGR